MIAASRRDGDDMDKSVCEIEFSCNELFVIVHTTSGFFLKLDSSAFAYNLMYQQVGCHLQMRVGGSSLSLCHHRRVQAARLNTANLGG